MRPITSILETVLYARDLDAAERFYAGTLGLALAEEPSELSVVFRVSDTQVLLIFDPAASSRPGRVVPSHGIAGPGHVAFRIDPRDLDAWVDRLRAGGVEIEQIHTWDSPRGGRSVYFRDPGGNSIEMVTADIWPGSRSV